MTEKSILVNDLTTCYYRILKENPKYTRMQICEILSQSPAPRFYTSLAYARRIIRDISVGKPRASRSPHAQMHRDIYDRWLSLADHSDEALQHLIESPAPSFYLSKHRIKYLLYRVYDRRKQSPSGID